MEKGAEHAEQVSLYFWSSPSESFSQSPLQGGVMCSDVLTQVRVLQAVVKDKDLRFQEQVQKHEEELLQLNARDSNNAELQQVMTHSVSFYSRTFKEPKNPMFFTVPHAAVGFAPNLSSLVSSKGSA